MGLFGKIKEQQETICCVLLLIIIGAAFLFGGLLINNGDVDDNGTDTTDTDTTQTDTYTTPYEPVIAGYKVKITLDWVDHSYTGVDLPFRIDNDATGENLFTGIWYLSEDGDSFIFDFLVQNGQDLNVIFDNVGVGIIGTYGQWNGYDDITLGESKLVTVGIYSYDTHIGWSTWGLIENACDIAVEFVEVFI